LTSRQSLSIGSVATTYHEVGVELDEPVSQPGVFTLHGAEAPDGNQAGVLLQPTGTGQTYRRVGMYKIENKTLREKPELSKLLPFQAARNGQNTITIV